MKLLFVLPEYGSNVRGGIATYYSHLLPALVRLGARVEVCVSSDQYVSPTEGPNGITVFSVDERAVVQAKTQLTQFGLMSGVQHLLAVAYAAWNQSRRGEGYDVVETTDFGLTFAPWLAASDGPPIVVQLHGSNGQVDYHDSLVGHELSGLVLRLLESALLGRADELQSHGASNALEWSQRLSRPVAHIWPAWTPDKVIPATVSADPELARCGLVIGRIQSWKGPEVLCRACSILGGRAPKILWIGSDNPYRRMDQSMAAYLESAHRSQWGHTVQPIGALPRETIIGMLKVAKFVVVPSKWDTFNLAAIEAMCAGKTVICSEGAGAAGLIDHGKNGFRFPSGNADRLAELIAEVDTLSTAERDAIGARARENIECTLAADTIAALRLDRYAKLAARGSRRKANLWGPNLCAADGKGVPFAFLEQVPLKPMVAQVAKRSLNKIRKVLV